jgi:hypothetical protein
MSTVIRVPEDVYRRLQKFAQPFEDTPASVIERVLTYYEAHHISASSVSPTSSNLSVGLRSGAATPPLAPDLTHTFVVHAHVGPVEVSNWNQLKNETFAQALPKIGFHGLQKVVGNRVTEGSKRAKGWVYRADVGISAQDTDANVSLRLAKEVAAAAQLEIGGEFEWKKVRGALKPGTRAHF